jgi:hypothetical protein
MPDRPHRRNHRRETPPPHDGAEIVRQIQLTRHLRQLGLESVEAYRDWCGRQGLSDALHKSDAQREQEWRLARRIAADAALAGARRAYRRPEETLRQIYAGRFDARALPAGASALSTCLRKISEAFTAAEGKGDLREALFRLLCHAFKYPRLLETGPAAARLGQRPGNTVLDGLFALACHHADWLRPVEAWKPESHSARRQFGSLARHLLARYPVPAFMDTAWFEGHLDTASFEDPAEAAWIEANWERAARHQEWFKHIGRGQNIRTADLPLALTKRMAHAFLAAPDDLLIEGALRYGQIRGLGGNERLARAVLATRLGEMMEDEPFWLSVLHFFVNNPMLDAACLGPIVDYIRHQRFVPRLPVAAAAGERPAGEEGPLPPPQPEFSMKGRTPEALLRLVDAWHRELARDERKPPVGDWAPSGIGGFLLDEGDSERGERPRRWSIRELLTSAQLREEGKAMSHCVATYAASCARGHVSIWSMQIQERSREEPYRVMTIAVNTAQRVITEARGRFNQLPGDREATVRLNQAPRILQEWARQEKLVLPSGVL